MINLIGLLAIAKFTQKLWTSELLYQPVRKLKGVFFRLLRVAVASQVQGDERKENADSSQLSVY